MPDTMTALLLDRPAEPEDLETAMRVGEVAVPEPGVGQVRLRVEACGLNLVDWKVARGGSTAWNWPHILGLDVAGTIDALGPGVATVMPLDAVPAAYARLAQGRQAGKLVCDVAGSAGA